VTPGSAADRAGLKQGDVIESFNGQPLHDFNSLRNRVAEAGPGSTAELVIVRDGAEKKVSVKLDEAREAPQRRKRSGPGTDDKAPALGVSARRSRRSWRKVGAERC
jgi:serine protease Do